MTYSRTEADYKTHRDEFESLSTKDRCQDLWNRFQTNWDAHDASLGGGKTSANNSDGRLSEPEKYRRIQQAFGRISGELVRFPDDTFERALSVFDQRWHKLRHGRAEIEPVVSSSQKFDDDEGTGGGCTSK
ncbi:hypothetical protein F442_09779 [Phytophthora nicotianae P10297]|uniref:Uncharacterized protein n=1 Tax=Phytophthora nicotianae P10297 TaxID=1317064 RepID=W2Z8V4_PHYNI|nr:hypothetical protein F442_09779 [Phytophthora nicotianae P10297]